MDGVYHLKTEMTNRPSDVCVDGCIYFKDQQESEEYCFGVVQESEAAILQCEVLHYSLYTQIIESIIIHHRIMAPWMEKNPA